MMKRVSRFWGAACLATALGVMTLSVANAKPPAFVGKGDQSQAIVFPDSQSDMPVGHGPGTIITGFEPPFTVGIMDNQQGWPVSGVNLPWATISNATPASGAQHVHVINDTSIAAGTNRIVFSPALAAQPAGPSVLECQIKISADLGANYQVIGQAPAQGLVTYRVDFNWSQGDTGTSPGNIRILDNPADNSGLQYVDTGVLWAHGVYKTLRVEFVAGGTIKYYYDGALIYTDLAQCNNGTANSVQQVLLLHDNFQNAGEFADWDDVSLTPMVATNGACCAGDGTCSDGPASACVGAASIFRGVGTECATTVCTGKCCLSTGFCENRTPGDCVSPDVFSGLCTQCGPATSGECLGSCCLPDGTCPFEDGPAPCAANGGIFGGPGSLCANAVCTGRCCTVNGACIANQSPNQCAAAPGGPGTLTLGGVCTSTTNIAFSGLSIAIPDGLANPGGAGVPAQNIQTVSGQTGGITDVNVDLQITHTWVGDLIVTIEHLGTQVIVIDGMGQAVGAFGGGCGSDNLNIILDDEGVRPIEDECLAAGAAATSPPNFTPNSPLSAFDGMDPNGAWTITIVDTFAADVGTLTGWSLHFQNGASPCTPACTCKGDMNGSGSVNGADINKFAQCLAAGGGPTCGCANLNGGGLDMSDVTVFVNYLINPVGSCVP